MYHCYFRVTLKKRLISANVDVQYGAKQNICLLVAYGNLPSVLLFPLVKLHVAIYLLTSSTFETAGHVRS